MIEPSRRKPSSIFIVTVNGYEETEVIGVFSTKKKAFDFGEGEELDPHYETGASHWCVVLEFYLNGKCLNAWRYNQIKNIWYEDSLDKPIPDIMS